MRKFILQVTFEDCYQELLLAIQEHVNKYGDYMSPYNSCIQSLYCEYDDETLYAKIPSTREEEYLNELIILTLENITQIPLFFNPNKGVEINNPELFISSEIYQEFINEERNVDAELHFIFYASLTNSKFVNNLNLFLHQLPKNLPFVVDVVAMPNDISSLFKSELHSEAPLMKNNLSAIIGLKQNAAKINNIKFNNIYFLQNFDENNLGQQFNFSKLTDLFGNLTLALIEGYDHIADNRLLDPITTFNVNSFCIDKYNIINNWSIAILKKLCDSIIGGTNSNHNVDKEKVNIIFKEILEEERQSLENIYSQSISSIPTLLNDWKDKLKEKILDKILGADLNNGEKDLLLSYFQNITNRDLVQLEEYDFDKLSLFDTLYISHLNQSEPNDPYTKIKEIILQIQKLKKEMEERKARILETRDLIDKNYHRDGKWTDDGYQIDDDVFRIHKHDGKDTINKHDDLFTEYESSSSLTDLPKNADLKALFPPVKNQKNQGACSSFSLTAVFEYLLSSEMSKVEDMSEAYVYYNGRAVSGQTDVDDGANLYDVIKGMADKGVCIEELCEYNPSVYDKEPSPEAYEDGKNRVVTNAKNVPVDVNTIKSAISEGYPVVGCFRVFESWQNNTNGFIPMPSDKERQSEKEGFHAMVICGYNDKHGHFIVRNSWGTKFGDKGYCYLPYSYIRDSDLTRYAVAITGINARNFIKPEPKDDDFDFYKKDKNIQYAILLNLLKEDEYRLDIERKKVKQLVNELRKLIDEIKSKEDINKNEKENSIKIGKLIEDNKNLEIEKNEISIWDNKLSHIIHAAILLVSLILIVLGYFKQQDDWWIIGTCILGGDIISWVVTTIICKRRKLQAIERRISNNKESISLLQDSSAHTHELRDKLISILDAIGDIDEHSGLNREILNNIIRTLNECYKEIEKYLKNNQFVDDKEILYPEWFKEIEKYVKIPNFLKRLLINSVGKDIKKIMVEIQKEILRGLNANFNKGIRELYNNGCSVEWSRFVEKIYQTTVCAQIDDIAFNRDPEQTKRKQCSYFISDLNENINLGVHKTDILSESRNRYLFIKIKKVKIEELSLFKSL